MEYAHTLWIPSVVSSLCQYFWSTHRWTDVHRVTLLSSRRGERWLGTHKGPCSSAYLKSSLAGQLNSSQWLMVGVQSKSPLLWARPHFHCIQVDVMEATLSYRHCAEDGEALCLVPGGVQASKPLPFTVSLCRGLHHEKKITYTFIKCEPLWMGQLL